MSAVETTIAKRNTPCEANLDGCTGGRTVLGGRAGRHCHCFRCVWDPLLGGVAIRSPIETAPPESSQKCCSAPLPLPPPPHPSTHTYTRTSRAGIPHRPMTADTPAVETGVPTEPFYGG